LPSDDTPLSVIIPTLNAATGLQRTLTCFTGKAAVGEVLVVDGGSTDETCAIAEKSGARLIKHEPGRGQQLARGAEVATGEWLLFLHADTVLSEGWETEVQSFTQGDEESRAAVFTYALDDDSPQARRVERMVRLRCWAWALPYGDQGLLISKRFYNALGGFKPMPLMEDVDLIRRIGRARLHYLKAKAITSAIRYHQGGYWRRPLFHLWCLCLYFVGVAPEKIAKLYR
jgi:rSAM/selenodomain-associated transferase 2